MLNEALLDEKISLHIKILTCENLLKLIAQDDKQKYTNLKFDVHKARGFVIEMLQNPLKPSELTADHFWWGIEDADVYFNHTLTPNLNSVAPETYLFDIKAGSFGFWHMSEVMDYA